MSAALGGSKIDQIDNNSRENTAHETKQRRKKMIQGDEMWKSERTVTFSYRKSPRPRPRHPEAPKGFLLLGEDNRPIAK